MEENLKINQIIEKIDLKYFIEADADLNRLINENKEIDNVIYSFSNLLRGELHENFQFKERNIYISERSYKANIESRFPDPKAFCGYSRCIQDKNVAINYLKEGLKLFPKNPLILSQLLRFSSSSEVEEFISIIKNDSISDANVNKLIVELLLNDNKWEESEYFIGKIVINELDDDFDLIFYKLLFFYSKIIQGKEFEKCFDNFKNLIAVDKDNSLNYSHYLGFIWCCLKLNKIDIAISYIQKIPLQNVVKDFYNEPWCPIEVNMLKIYENIFTDIRNIINSKEISNRIDIIEALYIYSPSEYFQTVRYKKKHYEILKDYSSKNLDNLVVSSIVFNIQLDLKLYFDAYKTFLSCFQNNQNFETISPTGISFIKLCEINEFNKVYNDILLVLDNQEYLSIKLYFQFFIDYLINYLWKSTSKSKYSMISELANKFQMRDLLLSDSIFEIAYSYNECKISNNRPEFLYKELIKKDKNNSSAINNLGVIYEKRNNLELSARYFKNALELDNSNVIYIRNYSRVTMIIQNRITAIENIKNENLDVLEFLEKLITISDHNREFIFDEMYFLKTFNLTLPIIKKLISKLKKMNYIVESTQENDRYFVDLSIVNYVNEQKNRIKQFRNIENIKINVSIIELEKIGYDNGLIDYINAFDNIKIRKIILRDIQECAMCFITQQYKSSIIMCGSIIEAMLNFVLKRSGFEKYNITNKENQIKVVKIDEMELSQLIEACKKEKLIKSEEYHLSNYLRKYRNIIHPAVEIREGIDITKDKAYIAWKLMITILYSIHI